MIVVPRESGSELEKILERFPGSRVTTKLCQLDGKPYLSIQSSNLDLLIYLAEMYPVNKDPRIARL